MLIPCSSYSSVSPTGMCAPIWLLVPPPFSTSTCTLHDQLLMFCSNLMPPNLFNWILPELDTSTEYEERALSTLSVIHARTGHKGSQ